MENPDKRCVVSGCWHSLTAHDTPDGRCAVERCVCLGYLETRETMPSDRLRNFEAEAIFGIPIVGRIMYTFGTPCSNPDCKHGHALHNKLDGRCRHEGCNCLQFVERKLWIKI
jgi:hypothetical protein